MCFVGAFPIRHSPLLCVRPLPMPREFVFVYMCVFLCVYKYVCVMIVRRSSSFCQPNLSQEPKTHLCSFCCAVWIAHSFILTHSVCLFSILQSTSQLGSSLSLSPSFATGAFVPHEVRCCCPLLTACLHLSAAESDVISCYMHHQCTQVRFPSQIKV